MDHFQKNLSHIGWDEVKRRQMQRLPLVHDWIRLTKMKLGMLVLDIGTGPGVFAREYAQVVGEDGFIYAIDKSTEALTYFLQETQRQDNIGIIHADAEISLSSIVQNIDIAMATDILHHSDAPEAILKNIYRHIKHAGFVLVAEFDPCSEGKIGPSLQNRLPIEKIKTFSRSAGFKIVDEGTQAFEHYYVLLQKL